MQWEEFRFNVRHLPETDQAAIERAFALGKKAHLGQKRKSGEPYFTHPVAVAHILADLGGDRDTIIAGLLHDTVEDTPVTIDEIERGFGPSVAQLIDGVTKLEHVDVADKPRLDQQIETLRKMFTLMQKDVRIMVIKLADRLHNMQTIEFRSPESQVRIARETMDVYVKIADRLCMRDTQNALESLCLSVLEPELHAQLHDIRTTREERGQRLIASMAESIRHNNPESAKSVEFSYEQKSWYRLREQLKAQSDRVTGIATMAMAIVCNNVDQCYRMMGALHGEWQREILSFQDFINSPMINGYRGLHTTIILEDGTRVRCKIRTKEMQEYAHRGVTVFCFDNKALGPLEYLPWTKQIDTIATGTSNRSAEFWDGLQSDILGSTIVIHGPDDRTIMLPIDATVLDAAFYLFGELALRTTTIEVNGRQAAFDEQLKNASTVNANFSRSPAACLRWLRSVRTALASAIIRKHLSSAPLQEKIAVGRELFDIAVQRLMRLRLEEVEPSLLESWVKRLGLQSQNDLFAEIAEGKMGASDAAIQVFADARDPKRATNKVASWTLNANVPAELEERVIRAVRAYPTMRVSSSHSKGKAVINVRMRASEQEVNSLDVSLATYLTPHTWSIRRITSTRVLAIAIFVLMSLWGLDPVVARTLLINGMSAYELTFIRALTFFAASTVLYSCQSFLSHGRLKWLSPFNSTLILSGAALFATALCSYVALSGIAATGYIFCIIAGLLAATLVREMTSRSPWVHTAMSLLVTCVGVALATLVLEHTQEAILAGIGSGLGFALYSELSRRYQREGAIIRARYPAFLFWMSCVGVVLALFLVPVIDLRSISPVRAATASLFALVFSVLPYSLYFEISRRMESTVLDRSLPLVTIVTVVGEFLFSRSPAPLVATPILLFFLAHFYGIYRRDAVIRAS